MSNDCLVYVGAMARPPAEGTKKRIRDAAAELFARHGVGRTTVREIAKAAGVNVAMVSHHFGGKAPLYRACLEAMYAELDGMQEQLLTALAEHDDLARAVREAVIGGYRYACAHRPAARLVMRHVIDTGGVPPERRDKLLVPFLGAASSALAQRTARDEAELRTVLMSLMFLTTRYALGSVEELAAVIGRPDAPAPDVQATIEQQLAAQAVWMLGLA